MMTSTSSADDLLVCIDNSDADEPLTDVRSIGMQMECNSMSSTAVSMTLCIYLTDQPFTQGNGTYHTITVPLNLTCTGACMHTPAYVCILSSFDVFMFVFLFHLATRDTESQCTASASPSGLGKFCLTPSLINTLFNSGEGQWRTLLSRLL